MNVAERGSLRHGWRGGISPRLGEQALDVERQRVHLERAAGHGPLVARAVPIELDPVPFRVGEVERLAHEMVGRAAQGPARLDDPSQGPRKLCPRPHEQGEVEEARRPRRPRGRIRIVNELDERHTVRPERRDPVLDAEGSQPDRRLVELA
jgi:hypothetical protein